MRRQKVIFGHLIRLVCVMILFLSQVDLLCADAVAADIQKVEARADIWLVVGFERAILSDLLADCWP